MRVRRAAALSAFVLTAFVSPAGASNPATTSGAESWQLSALDLTPAWQVTSGSPAIVAVVDSGVEADGPALQGRVLPGDDLVDGGTDTTDDNGHGTAVAGVVASVCPGCRILPVKVIAANGTADWTTVSAGIVWAADHGADVINLSLGAPRALDSVGAAVAYALAKGVIVVAAAGNDGSDESFYPADYPGVVSVAGIDQDGARSSWSNFGNQVTVAAPGCAAAPWLQGGSMTDFCGTSAAAPYVAGLAGLARAFDPKLTPAAFAGALATSATPLPDLSIAAPGIPDANRLLLALGAPGAPPTENVPPAVPQHATVGRPSRVFPGRWAGASSYQVVWQRRGAGATWVNITSGPAYVPRACDVGYRLRVVVTVSNARGTVTAASQTTLPVSAPGRAFPSRRIVAGVG